MNKGSFSVQVMIMILFLSLLPARSSQGAVIVGNYSPEIAHDPVHNRYLLVYDKVVKFTAQYYTYGRFINSDGSARGREFAISSAGGDRTLPSLAYDRVNQKFLVVWNDSRDDINFLIYGQLVNSDGSLHGNNFVIADATDTQWFPAVSYDSVNQRFLVVWEDFRGIYGQMVNADGSLYNTSSNVNFAISSASTSPRNPSLAFDNVNQRFLVAWADYRNGVDWDICGQLVNADGSLHATASDVNFVISDVSSTQSAPSVAFDSINQSFLVAWSDFRSGEGYDIYGQMVNADGSLLATASNINFVISDASGSQENPSAAFDDVNQRFLVAWGDGRSDKNSDIYGQFVNPDGSLYKKASGANFAISAAPDDQVFPAIAYNENFANFIVAYQTWRWDHGPDVDSVVVGKRPRVVLSSPNGGEVIRSGSTYPIRWTAPPQATNFKLLYSMDNGSTWNLIDRHLRGRSYDWLVPKPWNNRKACLVRVVGYDDSGKRVGGATSDRPFTIEVVRLSLPNGGGPLTSGETVSVTWVTNETKKPAKSAILYYSTGRGSTWMPAQSFQSLQISGNAGRYDWQIPAVEKTRNRCKLRVVLRDAWGKVVGSDITDGFFRIQPN